MIQNAQGLAIFTILRNGLWVSGSGGSGVLVARMNDGTWSHPSAITVQTMGLGFSVGVDIYDCVIVINSSEALRAFKRPRHTLGQEVSSASGLVSVRASMEMDWHVGQAPVFTYLKSRGYHAEVEMDGTVIIERADENERFYGTRIEAREILSGKSRWSPSRFRTLVHTLKAAQRDRDADISALPEGQSPGDFEIEENGRVFGIPDKDDLDPYGVLALEQQGLEIREAGSQSRPPSAAFDFRPNPTSPIYSAFGRRSADGRSITASSERSGRRASNLSIDRIVRSTETSAQINHVASKTKESDWPLMPISQSAVLPISGTQTRKIDHQKSPSQLSSVELADSTTHTPTSRTSFESAKSTGEENLRGENVTTSHTRTPTISLEAPPETNQSAAEKTSEHSSQPSDSREFDDNDDEEEDEDNEEPIIAEVQQAASPQFITKARLVTVNKPPPPKLPPRNPRRKPSKADARQANATQTSGGHRTGESPTSSVSGSTSSVRSSSSRRPSSGESRESSSSVDPIDGLAERIAKMGSARHLNVKPHKPQNSSPEDQDNFYSLPGTPGLRIGAPRDETT